MYDLIFFILICAMFFFIGFPITRLLPRNIFKMRILLSSVFGLCISSILVTLLYRYGLSINHIFIIFVITSILFSLFFLFHIIKKILIGKRDFFKFNRLLFVLILIWIIGSLILIAPRIIGEDQFSVFQGNQWDNFVYLNSSLVYSKEPYAKIINTDNFLQNPLILYAKIQLFGRPSTHILYAFVSQIFSNISYKLHYTFQVFFFSQTILVFMFIIINIIKNIFPAIIGLASLAFSLGFWGQYILDINAWSQISSIPIMLLIVGMIIILLGKDYIEIKNSLYFIKIIIIFSLLFSCSLYLYPESFLFHLPIIFIICLFYLISEFKNKKKWNLILLIFIGAFLGLISGFLLYDGIIKFVINQFKFASSINVKWWTYFQAFFLGRDNLNDTFLSNDSFLLNNIIDFISGFFGLYFITPRSNYNFILSFLSRLLLIGFITWMIYYLYYFIKKLFEINSTKESKSINKKQIILMTIFVLTVSGFFMAYNIFYNIKYAINAKAVSISINISDNNKPDGISVYRIPPKREIEIIPKKEDQWQSKKNYFKNILIKIPKKEINNIKQIDVKIGKKTFSFTKDDFLTKWKTIELKNDNIHDNQFYLTFQSPDDVSASRSKIKRFSSIINWPGEIKILINSIPYRNLITIISIISIILLLKILIKPSYFTFFENKKQIIILFISCITGLFLIILFLLKRDIWGAGKALSYISPYLILLIILPMFFINKNKLFYIISSPIFIFIILQISFGILRIYSSTQNNGIHYNLPYPSTQDINLKRNINWNMERIYPYIKDSKLIEVDIKNRWFENYLFDYLYVKNKNFYSINVINNYFGRGDDLGYQKHEILPDILITLVNNKLKIKSLSKNMIIYSD